MSSEPHDLTSTPDPIVSANLYHAGGLDDVVLRLAAPFWHDVRSREETDDACYLWLMRYGVGGEHVKFRIHGPPAAADGLRTRLEAAADDYLAQLDPADPELEQKGWRGAPPIDAEDAVDERHADHSFLWTEYRRSHVSLAGQPFLDDDRYASLFTRCLGAGCEWVLDALKPGKDGTLSTHQRRNALLKILISGLAALDYTAEQRADYLAFHRDWVLRYCFPEKDRFEVGYLDELVERCDRKAQAVAEALAPLATAAKAIWSQPLDIEALGTDTTARWQRALHALMGYLLQFRDDPDYRIDPFTTDVSFAPIFKVFHGIANQLGLDLFQEGFTHHLLRSVTIEPPAGDDSAEQPAAADA